MELKTEIICKNYEQLKIKNNKIYTNEQNEEYYIVPLTKSYDLESDDELFKLTFKNQLLWLKYSNRFGYITIKDFEFSECVIIKSEDIFDIYVKINTGHECFRKNVWHCHNNVSLNKRFLGKFILILPIINNMCNLDSFGEGVRHYQAQLITNEVVLQEVRNRGNGNGYVVLTNNVNLNQEALFVVIDKSEYYDFVG